MKGAAGKAYLPALARARQAIDIDVNVITVLVT